MIAKSLISQLSRAMASVYYTRYGIVCDVILAKHHLVPQLCLPVDRQKVTDSDESFDIFMAIKPYTFEPLAKGVTD